MDGGGFVKEINILFLPLTPSHRTNFALSWVAMDATITPWDLVTNCGISLQMQTEGFQNLHASTTADSI